MKLTRELTSRAELEDKRENSEKVAKQIIAELMITESLLRRRNQELQTAMEQLQTTQKRLLISEKRATAANQAKTTFLANMSHELRTPLTSIIGYAELLLEDDPTEDLDQLNRDIKAIHSSGNHLLSLVNEILDLAKIESGKFEVFLQKASLLGIADDIVATAGPLAEKNENEFRVTLSENLGEVVTDTLALRQCAINLLGNAGKFTTKGIIEFSLSRDDSFYTLTVADTGIGMTSEQLSTVFERFVQVDSSLGKKFSGTGLGLSITRKLCSLLGGRMHVHSKKDAGSTFSMTFPIDGGGSGGTIE